MRLVTANVKSNPLMRQKSVTEDVVAIKKLGSVIMWQEIAPHNYKETVKQAGPKRWAHACIELEIPISVDIRYWRIIKSGYRLTHKGRRGASPNRYISWALLEARQTREPKMQIVVVNSHYVSGAWGSKLKTFRSWRQQMWKLHHAIHTEMVLGWHTAGYTVLGGGDWNKTTVDKFHPDQRWVIKGSIDHLYVLEGAQGPTVEIVEADRENDVHTDHDPRIGTLRLRRRSH